MSIESEIEEIELSMAQAKKMVERKAALHRLYDNEDFKEIMLDGFFKNYAAECVRNRANGQVSSDPILAARVENDIIAIGSTQQFFNMIEQHGMQAEKVLEDGEETRDELLEALAAETAQE